MLKPCRRNVLCMFYTINFIDRLFANLARTLRKSEGKQTGRQGTLIRTVDNKLDNNCGMWCRIIRVKAFRPEGRGFESRSVYLRLIINLDDIPQQVTESK